MMGDLARRALVLGATLVITAGAAPPASAADGPHRVLRVGTFHGIAGQFATIQAAVDAARPGDWVLVGPGDYHADGRPQAGVYITMPGIHVRGMDRNRVVVDGTLAAAPGACDAAASSQGAPRSGIEVFRADGVSVENLTVCNFLAASDGGNQVWFNGGGGSGAIGMGSYRGAYLTATSSFFQDASSPAAMYGIFASNSRGPGLIEHSYASNMADSGFYVGACPDCNATLRWVQAENSALGYSGTNAGGNLTIEDSQWDLNRAGIVPNSLNNDDAPSPQNGACPDHPDRSCTVIRSNWVHDNDNPDTPAAGITSTAPVGTGIELSGGQNDTVRDNLITHQGAWGIVVHDFPDATGTPPPGSPDCAGGIPGVPTPLGPACLFVASGNRVIDNRLQGNGFFGNAGNGDLADANLVAQIPSIPTNCFRGNRDPLGPVTSDPAAIQAVMGVCGPQPGLGDTGNLVGQLLCAAFGPGSGACPPGQPGYPQPSATRMLPLPRDLTSMPDPCQGVPDNPWCQD